MSKPVPVHAPMDQFDTKDQHILVGGKNLDTIEAILDKSVFYAYDKKVVKAQIDKFNQAIPDAIKLHYAIKANPTPISITATLRNLCGIIVLMIQIQSDRG